MNLPRAILIFALLACRHLHAQPASLTWAAATNQLAGSEFVMTWRTSAGGFTTTNYPGTNCVWTQDVLALGLNKFAVAQIDTNAAGVAQLTPFSGEVWVEKTAVVQVEPETTNFIIMTSTNLGGHWDFAGLNSVTFPATQSQQFFKAVGRLKIALTNQLTFGGTNPVPMPPTP